MIKHVVTPTETGRSSFREHLVENYVIPKITNEEKEKKNEVSVNLKRKPLQELNYDEP